MDVPAESLRTFIAIPTNVDVQSRILEVLEELRTVPSDVKWDLPEKLHITLKFLGKVEKILLENIAHQVEDSVRTVQPFDITYDTIGCFPNDTQPRIIWVGATGNPSLVMLHELVDRCCVRLGFQKDDRPFYPHVTIGRVKNPRGINRLTAKVKNITLQPVTARCSEIHLMRSELQPGGSRYTVLKSIPLQS